MSAPTESNSEAAGPSTSLSDMSKKPVVCIVVGMAGSGKTTVMQRICAHLYEEKVPGYVINLDPAVAKLPFTPHIDIRDTIKYKEVMKQYNLGPNGAIMTSLNLFSTKFDQVMGLVEKRQDALKYVMLDTPGQIEVFTWSASGTIVTDTLASTFPTVLLYIIDTPRCTNPNTFMSNMLYACSVLYKSKLPMVVLFNKTDITSHDFALEWMRDSDSFRQALESQQSYISSLSNSMSLVLEEFYSSLKTVGMSAVTGEGIGDLFSALDEAKEEYLKVYLPILRKNIQKRKKMAEKEKRKQEKENMKKLERDFAAEHTGTTKQSERTTVLGMSEEGDDSEEDDDLVVGLDGQDDEEENYADDDDDEYGDYYDDP
eukprot:TRINITY_DN11754_c0_g1_i1.p1 TRINITY_DN11754_c0_g1~~TRINITY_DN11754_c0_g1_i1.p1  ORF type:complete len:371 (+),score=93.48 TRINITY_DN11754_c0_g1_i1:78-1190(+)